MAWVNTNPTEEILISDDHYYQPINVEWVPSVSINGVAMSFTRIEGRYRVRERVTRYAGVKADTTISGLAEECDLTTQGAYTFESHSVRWRRVRANPCGGYDIEKIEKWQAMYTKTGNNAWTWTAGAASSSF